MTELNVHSIFHSIDGECNGFLGAGQLSTFIRLKKCNLNCSFCDTLYAQSSDSPNWMTIDEIIKQIKFPKITITGGEPLLQMRGVESLCNELFLIGFEKNINYEISVETNGSIIPKFPSWENFRIIIDFKLPSSGMIDKMNLEAFHYWLRPTDIIKFVIADWNDYNVAVETVKMHPNWKAKIAFSPATTIVYPTLSTGENTPIVPGSVEPSVDMRWPRKLVERMIKDGIGNMFSLQMHQVIWPGAKEER